MNADASDNGGFEHEAEIVEKVQDAGRVFVEEAIKEASGSQDPRRSWIARFSRSDRGGSRNARNPQTPQAHKNRLRALLAVVVTAATVLLGVTAVAAANADTAAVSAPVITNPAAGSTSSTFPTVNGTGTTGDTVTVYLDGTAQTPTVTVGSNGNWTYPFTSPLTNGSHSFTATESDAAGDVSALSDPIQATVALAVPVITNPAAGSTGLSTLPLVVGMNAVAGGTVTVFVDGVAQTPTVTADNSNGWSYQFTKPLPNGSHAFTASETDSIGNTSALSSPIEATVGLAVPTITSPNSGDTVSTLPDIVGMGAVAGGTVTVFVDGVAQTPTATADSSGGWSYQFTKPLPDGSHTFTASESDALGNVSADSSPVTVTVSAGSGSTGSGSAGTGSTGSTDSTAPTPPTANPTDGTVITGTGTPGDTIVITVNDGGTISQVAAPVTVDAEGNWTVTPSSPLPTGTGLYVVDVNSAGTSSAPTVVLVGTGIPNVDYSGWALSTSTAAANGTSTITATLHVVGLDGGNVSGLTITPTFTANTDGATASATFPDGVTVSPVTSTPGLNSYTFTLTSTAQLSGQLGATAVVQGKTYTFSTTGINFVAAPVATGSNWSLTAPASTSVDGAPSYQVWIELLDASGNPVSGQLNNLTINASGAAVTSFTEDTTGGIYVANITSTKAGSFPVTVSLNGDPITEQSNYPTSVVFTTGAVSPAASSLAVTAGTELANGTDTQTATATVTDQYGNPVVGASVDFSLEEASGAGFVTGSGAPTPSVTVVTNASGVAAAQLAATTGGTYHLGAAVGGTPISGSPTSTSFVSGTVNADASSWALGAASPSTDVDASASYPVTISLVGTNGAPVAGAASDLTVNASGAAVSPVIDGGNGRYTATVSSTKAGSFPVTVSLGSGAAALQIGETSSAVFTAGAPVASQSSLTVSANAATANGSDTQTASVSVLDQFGNPVAGASVDFSLQEASGAGFLVNGAVSPTATVAAGANGTAQVQLGATTAGTYHVVAQLGGIAVQGSPAAVSFGSSAVDAANSSWSLGAASTTDVDNNPSYPVTVTLKDAGGKPVTGAASNISITTTAGAGAAGSGSGGSNGSAGVTVGAVTDNGDGTYTATITGTKAGSFPVSVSLGSGTSGQTIPEATTDASGSVVFTPGAVSGTASQFTVTNNPALANGSDTQTATVTVTDQYGNPVDNAPVTISTPDAWGVGIVVGSTVETSATVSTNSVGWAQVKISATTGGNYLVAAGVGGTVISGYYQNPAYASFASGVPAATASDWGLQAPANTDVTVSPAPTYHGSITLKDANGNPVTGAVGDITINASGATVVSLSETSTPGVYWFYISSTKPGAFPVTVSVAGGQIGASTVAVFTAGAAAPSASTVSATRNTALANGSDTQTVSVRVTDQAGNPVNGAPVSFGLQEASGASLLDTSNSTSAVATPASTVSTTSSWDGGASVAVTATEAGTYHVAVTVNGVAVAGSPAAVTFASGTAVASNSSWILAVPSSTSVDDSPAYTVTVTLKDVNGAPVTGAASYLSISAGSATASPVTDNGDGTYTATITSATAGTFPVTVTVGGTPVNPASGSATSAVFTGSSSVPVAPVAPVVNPTDGSTLTGTAEPDSTVTVRDADDNIVCTVTADPTTGVFGCGFNPALANGTVLSVTARNAGGTSPATSVTVNTTSVQLATPVITSPAYDLTTSDTLFTVQGTGSAGDTVTLSDSGTVVASGIPVQSDGSWSYTPTTPYTVATHTFTATQTDVSGSVSAASDPVVVFVAAASLPTPTITAPTNGLVTNNTTPLIYGTGVAGGWIALFDGPTQIAGFQIESGGGWYYTPSALAYGTHTLTAVQSTDHGVASAVTGPVTFTITQTPVLAAPVITTPTDGLVTNNTSPYITGTGIPGDTVTVLDGTTVVTSTASVGDDGTWWTYSSTPFAAGVHVLTATQRDSSGNTSAVSASVSFTVSSAPVIAAPVIAAPVSGTVTNAAQPVLSGTGVAGDVVTLSDGSGPLTPTARVAADGSWSSVLAPLAAGTYTFTATQADDAGNVSAVSNSVSLTVVLLPVLAPPVISAPVDGTITNNTTPRISGTGVPGDWVALSDGSTVLNSTIQVQVDGSWWFIPATALPYGVHTFTATQTNTSEQVSGVSNTVSVTVTSTPVLAAPVITAPVNGSSTTSTTPVISGTGIAGDTVSVLDGSAVLTSSVTVASDGSWSFTPTTALAVGSHSLTATQSDASGNTSAVSSVVSVTVQAAAPVVPAAPVITSPSSGSTVTTATPVISGTGVAGATVTVSDAAGALTPTVTVGSDGTWSLTLSTALANGSYTFTAVQSNANGTSAVSVGVNVTVSVQTPPPSGGSSSGPSLSDVLNAIVNVVATIVKTIVSVVVSIRNLFSW